MCFSGTEGLRAGEDLVWRRLFRAVTLVSIASIYRGEKER